MFLILMALLRLIDQGFQHYNNKRMSTSDKRGKLISEILSGAKVIKFNAWEKIMNKLVKQLRDLEGALIFKSFTLYNLSQALSTMFPTFLGLLVFLLYERINGQKMEIAKIYELVTVFNATIMPIRYFVMALLGRTDAMASTRRINELIKVDPIEPLGDDITLQKGALELKHGNFNWEDPYYYQVFTGKKMKEKTKNNFILSDISLRVAKGEFVAVVGKVGSGKSSLILAMMDEMVRHSGTVRKHGRIAYISQEAFLQNDTILNNVIFGKKFDQHKFFRTLEICQMMPDLAILPGKELTEIGERGANMSGGQKQRINIARAVYADSDIYLIDDALSALDAHVGKKIMNDVFLGELGRKTRVMVTHYLHLLDSVDKVVLVDKGRIKAYGSVEEVRRTKAFQDFSNSLGDENGGQGSESSPGKDSRGLGTDSGAKKDTEGMDSVIGSDSPLKFESQSHMTSLNLKDKPSDLENPMISPRPRIEETDPENAENAQILENFGDLENDQKLQKDNKIAQEEVEGGLNEAENAPEDPQNIAELGKLMKNETRETGSIGMKYFVYYAQQAGISLSIYTLLFFTLSIALKMGADWWVGQWMEDKFNLPTAQYMTIYTATGVATILSLTLRAFALGYVSKLASVNIFKTIVWNILRRPMSFFDTTPAGSIMNRCTSDIDYVDFWVPWMNTFFFTIFFNFLGALILASVASPAVILLIVVGLTVTLRAFKVYMMTLVEIKRMVQLSQTPMLSLFLEFIDGCSVIRTYEKREEMLEKYRRKADVHHEAYFHEEASIAWIRLRLEGSMVAVMVFAVFSVVIGKQIA